MFLFKPKTIFIGLAAIGTSAAISKPANENLLIEMTQNASVEQKIMLFTAIPFITTFHDYVFFKTATIYTGDKNVTCVGFYNHWYYIKE